MINSIGVSNSLYYQRAQQKQQNRAQDEAIKEQYNEIYAHEQAHKSAAGSLGGPIVIEKNYQGIPIGGHVNIKMPALNKENPEETIKQADTVIKSAMAPSDPSNQDYKVASEARSIRTEAKNIESKNEQSNGQTSQAGLKLNLIA